MYKEANTECFYKIQLSINFLAHLHTTKMKLSSLLTFLVVFQLINVSHGASMDDFMSFELINNLISTRSATGDRLAWISTIRGEYQL
jgi:hypothetical protein